MKMYIVCLMLFLLMNFGKNEVVSVRVYTNPLTRKAVDVWFLVDETDSRLSLLQHGQIKIALGDIATHLNPAGSNPNFAV